MADYYTHCLLSSTSSGDTRELTQTGQWAQAARGYIAAISIAACVAPFARTPLTGGVAMYAQEQGPFYRCPESQSAVSFTSAAGDAERKAEAAKTKAPRITAIIERPGDDDFVIYAEDLDRETAEWLLSS